MMSCGACASQTVVQVKKTILDGAGSAQAESEIQMYLLALKNSLLPEAIPIFTKYAESEVGAYSTIALTALQRYDVNLITDEVRRDARSTPVFFFVFLWVSWGFTQHVTETETKRSLVRRWSAQLAEFTTRINGSTRKTWELPLPTSSSAATRHTWRSRICFCLSETCLMKWTSTCSPRSRTSSASRCQPGVLLAIQWSNSKKTQTKTIILFNRQYLIDAHCRHSWYNIYLFYFFSKVLQQAMKDMVSHNYDRFAKVGSSSAFSGFMARK